MDEITVKMTQNQAVSVMLALRQAVRSNGEETDKGRHCRDIADAIKIKLLASEPPPISPVMPAKAAGHKSQGSGV